MLFWLMLGYESWQRKRLRRIEQRTTLDFMAQKVREFRCVVTQGSQDCRSAGYLFMDGYSRAEKRYIALSQEPLFFAAKQLGIPLPKDCRAMSSNSDVLILSFFEEWSIRRQIRKQRWKRIIGCPSLLMPIVSAMIFRGCCERCSPDEQQSATNH